VTPAADPGRPHGQRNTACPDTKGMIAAVSAFVFEHGGNVVHADQRTDSEESWFVRRVE